MQYHFFSFKFYITGLAILILIFFFSWLPRVQIDLIVYSEPLIMDFEIKLDTQANGVLLNLDTIPSKIVNSQSEESWPGYRFINDLEGQGGQIIIFQQNDLQQLVFYKTNALLNQPDHFALQSKAGESNQELNKQVFKFHPEKWDIEIKSKDLSAGQGTILLSLQEEVVKEYDFDELRRQTKFKKIALVKEELKSILSVRDVQIKPFPWFLKQMPLFLNHIDFSLTIVEN